MCALQLLSYYPQQIIQTHLRTVGFGLGLGLGFGLGRVVHLVVHTIALLVVDGVVVTGVVVGVVVVVDWTCWKSLRLQVGCPALTTSVRSNPFPLTLSHLNRQYFLLCFVIELNYSGQNQTSS